MSGNFVTLHHFNEGELVFDENETKEILKFFFLSLRQRIELTAMTTELREFAQGLLVEAIDATYALGYVEVIFKTFYNPGHGMAKVLSKAGGKLAKHWFKHATQRDLIKAKISSRVRDQLAQNFASVLLMMLDGIAKATQIRSTHIAYVDYGEPSKADTAWA